jgi:hypothetical protein
LSTVVFFCNKNIIVAFPAVAQERDLTFYYTIQMRVPLYFRFAGASTASYLLLHYGCRSSSNTVASATEVIVVDLCRCSVENKIWARRGRRRAEREARIFENFYIRRNTVSFADFLQRSDSPPRNM